MYYDKEILIENIKANLKQLNLIGDTNQVSMRAFKTEFKRLTIISEEKTIAKHINNLIEMGYIKKINDLIIEFSVEPDTPYVFKSDTQEVVK